MKTDPNREGRLAQFLRDHRSDPAEPKSGEEARILAAVRSLQAKKRTWSPRTLWLPATAVCAVIIALAIVILDQNTARVVSASAENGDVETYLKETIVAVYSDVDGMESLPSAGTQWITLADSVAGETAKK